MIAKVFRSRTELRLKNEEKIFEFNAGGEEKPMKLLCHKRGDVRETVENECFRKREGMSAV